MRYGARGEFWFVEPNPSVVFLKFVEQLGKSKWFEEQPSGAKAHSFYAICGTTEVVP